MKKYIGSFAWERGSINDNIVKVLIAFSIGYYRTFNGDIYTSNNRKVVAEHIKNDEYHVYIIF